MEELRKRLIGETDAEAYQRVCIEKAALVEENRRLRCAMARARARLQDTETPADDCCIEAEAILSAALEGED